MSNDYEERSVVLNFLAGMGLGALIGAATALLLAPKSGAETRGELASATEDFREKASKVVHELSESSEELMKKSRELMEATKSKVQSAVEAGKQCMATTKEELKAEEGRQES